MERDGSRRRAIVAALLAGTAVLAPVSAFAGYAAGQELRRQPSPATAAAPTAAASAPVTASAGPTTPAGPSAPPTELSPADRQLAQQATVRLSPASGYYLGSGSIISADGLVLTNAHVARPTAPGLAAVYGGDTFPEPDPERLVVSTTDGDGPAEPAYLADVLAVDGHLDLAVLRISSLADGSPLPAGRPFPFVQLGTVADLELGDDLTVYGFPALNGGDLLTVRTGVVSSFLPDRSGRVPGDRYEIETSADFSGGNSGGMALSNDGRLVGVPSARLTSEELAVAHFVRSVDLAGPLITAAQQGVDYRSPHTVAGTGREQATDLGWAYDSSCDAEGGDLLEADGLGGYGRIALQDLAPEQDVLLVLTSQEGVQSLVADVHDETQECWVVPLPYDDEGALVEGSYLLDVLVGPDRRNVLTSEVVVAGG